MSSKEEVVILFDKSKQQEKSFDLNKLTKFLNSLSENVSCKIYSTETFSKRTHPFKLSKSVLFLQDEEKVSEIVEDVRKRFDAEEGVRMKVITSKAGKTKLAASRELLKAADIITCEALENIDEWFPKLLMFLFQKSMEQTRGGETKASLFMFDCGNALELEWFKKTTLSLKQFGKICLSTGDDDVENHSVDDIENVIIVSRGDGEEVWGQNSNVIDQLKRVSSIKFLIFTDKPKSDFVKTWKDTANKMVYNCRKDLDLNYKMWTFLLQQMSLIDCRNVALPSNENALKILKIVGIVLAAIFIGLPLVLILIALFLACAYYSKLKLPSYLEYFHFMYTNEAIRQ